MGKLKRFFCCGCCDPERGDVYEVSRAADIHESPLQNVICSLETAKEKESLSVCQPPALCEGHVDSIVEQHEFNPPFSSTKVDNSKHDHVLGNSSCATCPDSSGFCTEDVPTYPSDNHFAAELTEDKKKEIDEKAEEKDQTLSDSKPFPVCEDDTPSTEQEELNSTINSSSVDNSKDNVDHATKDPKQASPDTSGFCTDNVSISGPSDISGHCSENVNISDPSDIHYVTTVDIPEQGTKEVTILGRCSVLYSPTNSKE